MNMNEMDSKVKELRKLRRMADELSGMIEDIQDSIKAEMVARNTDTLTGSNWKVTWKAVTSSRLDSKALKATLPDVYKQFCKTSTSRRFILV